METTHWLESTGDPVICIDISVMKFVRPNSDSEIITDRSPWDKLTKLWGIAHSWRHTAPATPETSRALKRLLETCRTALWSTQSDVYSELECDVTRMIGLPSRFGTTAIDKYCWYSAVLTKNPVPAQRLVLPSALFIRLFKVNLKFASKCINWRLSQLKKSMKIVR